MEDDLSTKDRRWKDIDNALKLDIIVCPNTSMFISYSRGDVDGGIGWVGRRTGRGGVYRNVVGFVERWKFEVQNRFS